MEVQDQSRWLAQQAEIMQEDPEIGREFIAFIEEWCKTSEAAMGHAGKILAPVEALRVALEPTELRRGTISGNWMVQMLLVIGANWGHGGDELIEAMTVFERRFVGDMAAIVVATLQESATRVPSAPV